MTLSRAFAALTARAAALVFSIAFLGSGSLFAPAFAQELDIVDIRSGKYKMTEYGETGEEIPRKGPVIEVYSNSGIAYDTIANDNEGLWFTLGVKGRCAGNQRVGKAELSLPDGNQSLKVNKRRQSYSRSFKTITARSGFLLPDIGRTPMQACMKELNRRVAGSNLSREEWIERGFVVKYDDAYKLGFALTCNQGRGWNQFGEAETSAPVWIACQPSKVAAGGAREVAPAETAEIRSETRRLTRLTKPAQPAEQEGLAEPAALPEMGQLVSGLTLGADKENYRGRCPVALRFSGAVSVSRAGRVRYRLADHEGNASPVRSLKFVSAGSQNIVGWSRAFASPAAASANAGTDAGTDAGTEGGPEKGPDYEGWVQIEVIEPSDAQPSDRADYTIVCE
ncbi:MAG: hypothetical protein IID51_06090 [Proteobacteria bacterium]|nr:hypothetical protein [Pseudomonadota bacterium]